MKYNIRIREEDGSEKINIGSEEIENIEYTIQVDNNSFVNLNSEIYLNITGKILNNKDNKLKKIIEWSNSYKDEKDYKEVEIEILMNDDDKINIVIKSMFVTKLYHSFSIKDGYNKYILELKQKYTGKDKKFIIK